jgi:hypothetical protein
MLSRPVGLGLVCKSKLFYYLGAQFMAQALPIHDKARFTGAQTYAEVSVTIIFWHITFHAGFKVTVSPV